MNDELWDEIEKKGKDLTIDEMKDILIKREALVEPLCHIIVEQHFKIDVMKDEIKELKETISNLRNEK